MELTEKPIPVSDEAAKHRPYHRVTLGSPTSEWQAVVNGETSSADFRPPEGGVLLNNDRLDHYRIRMHRVQRGQTNFSVFVPQNRRIGRATIHSAGSRTDDLEIGEVRMQATVDSDHTLGKLSVPPQTS